ncbi:polysaccharide deacetylase family protein [Polynucleobacter sp. 73C-SIWE]|uniref:polysaccharide deacetylase family protein n=1 Tax=Polynucleobacter sp. 73C-SIWE TaxID=2689098 RepID=UPI001C0ABF09|nr:polysaccharide deacetylase family protein [Polynucleobacter sp. 73C-SIWE]MBU3578625.1 polysaccharide deacetylase family protein [Polynucleobacter sp. 73C-SIWE]
MNILSFDVEDWFHIRFDQGFFEGVSCSEYPSRVVDSVMTLLNLLDEVDIKASFFCLGWVVERYPSLITEIDRRGHEIGSHSFSHRLLTSMDKMSVKEDISSSIKILEDCISKKVQIYRAPAFSICEKNSWALDILLDHGVEIDCSVFSGPHDFGGIKKNGFNKPFLIKTPSGSLIKELPIGSAPFLGGNLMYSGGGYFRILPYFLIKYFMDKSNYNMMYFHPRDFDPDQPMMNNLTIARRFKSYVGLGGSLRKLRCLIADFTFLTVTDAARSVDWNIAPHMEIHKSLHGENLR